MPSHNNDRSFVDNFSSLFGRGLDSHTFDHRSSGFLSIGSRSAPSADVYKKYAVEDEEDHDHHEKQDEVSNKGEDEKSTPKTPDDHETVDDSKVKHENTADDSNDDPDENASAKAKK
eukprot:GILJ01023450.1.p1 GENE.GILJ01023450.1~~GILJ01023450.1.p1  ORF type:complete len:117 (+),score=30.71 GILJ01023450.1:61-411(+)